MGRPASVVWAGHEADPVGVILGVTLLHDRLGLHAILGGALIIGTAIMFTRRPEKAV